MNTYDYPAGADTSRAPWNVDDAQCDRCAGDNAAEKMRDALQEVLETHHWALLGLERDVETLVDAVREAVSEAVREEWPAGGCRKHYGREAYE